MPRKWEAEMLGFRSNCEVRVPCQRVADFDEVDTLSLEFDHGRIPPAFGLQAPGGGSLWETYTGDGRISYWNNYVAVTQMGGHGSFSDPRIAISITQTPDLVTPKLPALLQYQLSLQTPPPPAGSFDKAAARRGERLFNGAAGCATCHVPPLYTDVLNGP